MGGVEYDWNGELRAVDCLRCLSTRSAVRKKCCGGRWFIVLGVGISVALELASDVVKGF